MGWTSYYAKFYKNGKIDRKAECDDYFRRNAEYYELLKSSMVGTTYYGAVRNKKNQKVFAVVFLTSVDGYEFYYKDMTESCNPYSYDCPKSILNLLSDTDNEFALSWRQKCYENIEKQKNKNSLNNLPLGSVIEITLPFSLSHYEKGETVQLTKEKFWHNNRTYWATKTHRFTNSLMKALSDNFKVIEMGV